MQRQFMVKISASIISLLILYMALALLLSTISGLKMKASDPVNVTVYRQTIKKEDPTTDKKKVETKTVSKTPPAPQKSAMTKVTKQNSAPEPVSKSKDNGSPKMISRGAILAATEKTPSIVVHYQSKDFSEYLDYLSTMRCVFILSNPAGTPAASYDPRSPNQIGQMIDNLSGYSRQLRTLGEYDDHPVLNRILDLYASSDPDLSFGYGCKLSALWSEEFEYMLVGTIESAAIQKGLLYTDIESAQAFFSDNTIKLRKIVTVEGVEVQI